MEFLRGLLERQGGSGLGPVAVADLFRQAREQAEAEGLPFPRTAQGFGRRLSVLRRVLELELGVRFQEERGHRRERRVSLTPRTAGDDGDVGGDVGRKVSIAEGQA